MTVRSGPKLDRFAAETLDEALTELEERLRAVARVGAVKTPLRDFEPVQRVAARAELKGPGGLRGGIDVRGDGSTEAYTGRWRKQLLAQEDGESAYAALRRALSAESSVSVEP